MYNALTKKQNRGMIISMQEKVGKTINEKAAGFQIEELVQAVKNSDIRAYKQVFKHFHPMLFHYLYVRCMDYDLCQDIAQEVFVRLWEKRTGLNPKCSFWAYLVKIAENLYKDHCRHVKVKDKHNETVTGLYERSVNSPDKDIHFKQLQQVLIKIVNHHLPPKCREIFILSRFKEKSIIEIAEMLNISKKTVENQLSKALQIIRKKIIKYL